ncbi:hypothetical protein HDU97_008241, partial [Phlyctochytrium planicorne]
MLTETMILAKSKGFARASTVRDLTRIKTINLWGQGISDVSFLVNLPQLEVISFAVNSIRDLEPFSFLTSLRELYLRKNQIADPLQLLHLVHLPLTDLWVHDNPFCDRIENYRVAMIWMFPGLRRLDDRDVQDVERREGVRVFGEVVGGVEGVRRVLGGASREGGAGGEVREGKRDVYDREPPVQSRTEMYQQQQQQQQAQERIPVKVSIPSHLQSHVPSWLQSQPSHADHPYQSSKPIPLPTSLGGYRFTAAEEAMARSLGFDLGRMARGGSGEVSPVSDGSGESVSPLGRARQPHPFVHGPGEVEERTRGKKKVGLRHSEMELRRLADAIVGLEREAGGVGKDGRGFGGDKGRMGDFSRYEDKTLFETRPPPQAPVAVAHQRVAVSSSYDERPIRGSAGQVPFSSSYDERPIRGSALVADPFGGRLGSVSMGGGGGGPGSYPPVRSSGDFEGLVGRKVGTASVGAGRKRVSVPATPAFGGGVGIRGIGTIAGHQFGGGKIKVEELDGHEEAEEEDDGGFPVMSASSALPPPHPPSIAQHKRDSLKEEDHLGTGLSIVHAEHVIRNGRIPHLVSTHVHDPDSTDGKGGVGDPTKSARESFRRHHVAGEDHLVGSGMSVENVSGGGHGGVVKKEGRGQEDHLKGSGMGFTHGEHVVPNGKLRRVGLGGGGIAGFGGGADDGHGNVLLKADESPTSPVSRDIKPPPFLTPTPSPTQATVPSLSIPATSPQAAAPICTTTTTGQPSPPENDRSALGSRGSTRPMWLGRQGNE